MNQPRVTFAIRRDAFNRCYQIVMFTAHKEATAPVQTNIMTLEKAEKAVQEWIAREKQSREQEDSDAPPAE